MNIEVCFPHPAQSTLADRSIALVENPEYTRMKIENVTNYSFGQDDNGKPVVWAAGKAGWYEVTPSDRYLPHYHDTVEAIDLFYFMVDQYQKLSPKRKRLGFQVDPFLTAYQKHTDFRIDDDDEAMETIHKHHKFILKQMIEEREGIDWSQTHLWNHLAETYADEIETLRLSAIVPRSIEQTSEEESSNDSSNDSPVIRSFDGTSDEPEVPNGTSGTDQTDSRASQTAQSESDVSSESESESEADNEIEEEEEEEEEDQTDWTRTIFDLLNVVRKISTFPIKTCGIEQLASELVKLPVFPGNHKAAVAAIERSAEPLLRLMNEAKLRKKFNWSTRTIYAELEATLADDIAEDVKTPIPRKGKDRHRMKSVLRPSGATKSRKRNMSTNDDDEEMTDEQAPQVSSPTAKRQPLPRQVPRSTREQTVDTIGSRDDSPSRQLNGHYDPDALPYLPPPPEAQEMIDLVQQEARRVGRQNQTSHLQAFLGGLDMDRF